MRESSRAPLKGRSERPTPRLEQIGVELELLRARCNVRERLEADPVSIVRRYRDPIDQEVVGVMASAVAFGNAKAFRAKLEEALQRLGPDILRAIDDEAGLFERLRGWRHRVYGGEELARLLSGARRVQRESGTLGARFVRELDRTGGLRPALSAFVAALRDAGGLSRATSRGASHILADPDKSSGCKRLLLFLRWMVRPDDGVDLGLWPVPPSILLIPVDTHVHKLARNLGLTASPTASWRTAEEITAALARLDPEDPVKFDFALCHLGMLQRCPSRRDPERCRGCGILAVCRHWSRTPRVAERGAPRGAFAVHAKRDK